MTKTPKLIPGWNPQPDGWELHQAQNGVDKARLVLGPASILIQRDGQDWCWEVLLADRPLAELPEWGDRVFLQLEPAKQSAMKWWFPQVRQMARAVNALLARQAPPPDPDPWLFCVVSGETAFGNVEQDVFSQTHSCVLIARTSQWKTNKCLSDGHILGVLPKAAQELLSEEMESVFSYRGTVEEAKTACSAAGLQFSPEMAEALKDFYV